MTDLGLLNLVVLPIGLGLLGFIEPCSIGSSLVFIKYLEGQSASAKLAQVGVFAVTRALLIGALRMMAVLAGSTFLGVQKGAWIFLGAIYVAIGALYLTGRARALMLSLGRAFIALPACAFPPVWASCSASIFLPVRRR